MKKEVGKSVSLAIATLVLVVIALAGPAQAFTISLNFLTNEISRGELLVFTGEIDINNNENLAIEKLVLFLNGPENISCSFLPNATILENCEGISIQSSGNATFGYGYGFTNGKLVYEFTLDTSYYLPGEYSTNLNVHLEQEEFSNQGDNITIHEPDLILNVYSPEIKNYDTKRVQFNITTSKDVLRLDYINYNDEVPQFATLCQHCNGFANQRIVERTLNEDHNKIVFRATSYSGEIITKEINLFIDSVKPSLVRTEPKKDSYFNGNSFYIKFLEENPRQLSLIIDGTERVLSTENCTTEKVYTECYYNINLSEYNNKKISYSFKISDPINTFQSPITSINVDTLSPVLTINSPQNTIYSGKVLFDLNVTEKSRIEYYNPNEQNPKWKLITETSSRGGARLSFQKGSHTLQIRATDLAGNSNTKQVSFQVV